MLTHTHTHRHTCTHARVCVVLKKIMPKYLIVFKPKKSFLFFFFLNIIVEHKSEREKEWGVFACVHVVAKYSILLNSRLNL